MIWTAGIGEHAKTLIMQDDGNLVLFTRVTVKAFGLLTQPINVI